MFYPFKVVHKEVSLLDIINGANLSHTECYNVECDDCLQPCTQCKGKGTTIVPGHVLMRTVCDLCTGNKYLSSGQCEICKGKGSTAVEEIFNYRVEPGTHHKDKILVKGKFDFHVEISIANDPIFRRSLIVHEDLEVTYEISLLEALCGFSKTITSIDNMTTEFVSTNVIGHDLVKVPGFGLPFKNNPKKRGNLIAFFDIKYPKELTDEQKDKLREILVK